MGGSFFEPVTKSAVELQGFPKPRDLEAHVQGVHDPGHGRPFLPLQNVGMTGARDALFWDVPSGGVVAAASGALPLGLLVGHLTGKGTDSPDRELFRSTTVAPHGPSNDLVHLRRAR